MKIFKQSIDKQLESNQGKNLFFDGVNNSFSFIPETLKAIERIGEVDKDSENILIDYVTNKALQEFCKINQFYSFDTLAQKELREIYVELFANIKTHKNTNDSISKKHFKNLTNWLKKTNPFAEKMYSFKDDIVDSVACSEYSPDLQIKILQINLKQIVEPVLDIGCGKDGNLVMYFRKKGIEANGFDRFMYENSFLSNSDWLEYNYGIDKWGTITSNLGFSNHFKHHHFRDNGNFVIYAKKYMDILNSLKIGGSFHYAPDLPFIEKYLDKTKFKITAQDVGVFDYKSIKIKRLK